MSEPPVKTRNQLVVRPSVAVPVVLIPIEVVLSVIGWLIRGPERSQLLQASDQKVFEAHQGGNPSTDPEKLEGLSHLTWESFRTARKSWRTQPEKVAPVLLFLLLHCHGTVTEQQNPQLSYVILYLDWKIPMAVDNFMSVFWTGDTAASWPLGQGPGVRGQEPCWLTETNQRTHSAPSMLRAGKVLPHLHHCV